MKLTLPLPPNLMNLRGSSHWRKVHRLKAAYQQEAMVRILQQTRASERGDMQASPRVSATVTLYVWGMMDDDNAVGRCKLAIDALRRNGIIRDDKRPIFALSGIPTQVIDRKNQRLEITLSPA